MSEIIEGLKKISSRSMVLQVLAVVLGIVGSIALVIIGQLEEGIFDIIISPFTGIVTQLQIVSLTTAEPIAILLVGILSFIGLLLIPGVILSRLLYSELNGFTRLVIGTSISLLLIFFPLIYGLLFGIAPSWLIVTIPFIASLAVSIIRPKLVTNTYSEFLEALEWIRTDMVKKKNLWFWIILLFFAIVRLALFSYTDTYATDSVTYVGYAEAMLNGTLLRGLEFTNPIGFPVIVYPFIVLTGSITWGMAVGNWILTIIAMLGFYPILNRIYLKWPTQRKPPFRLFLLVFAFFPWNTILMSSLFHESVLLFVTCLGASAIGERIKYSEIWLGLAIGVAYLIRPTHAVMYFIFLLIPLYEHRHEITVLLSTGIRSFVVALPVIPLLVRNFLIDGWIFSNSDLEFYSLSNIPDVLWWLASFITHSSVGFFTLLFVIPLVISIILMVTSLREFNAETYAWILLGLVSFAVFSIWPTDQPRFYSFFFWLIPLVLLMECWNIGWDFTCLLFAAWEILIFCAIPFSPQGWIIDGGSSYLSNIDGLVRVLPTLDVALSYVGSFCSIVCWIILGYLVTKKHNDKLSRIIDEKDMSAKD